MVRPEAQRYSSTSSRLRVNLIPAIIGSMRSRGTTKIPLCILCAFARTQYLSSGPSAEGSEAHHFTILAATASATLIPSMAADRMPPA